jgi:hypothetical protein
MLPGRRCLRSLSSLDDRDRFFLRSMFRKRLQLGDQGPRALSCSSPSFVAQEPKNIERRRLPSSGRAQGNQAKPKFSICRFFIAGLCRDCVHGPLARVMSEVLALGRNLVGGHHLGIHERR